MPQTIVVASARIRDTIELEAMEPQPLTVRRGMPFDVAFLYDLKEASKDREAYRFILESSIDGAEQGPTVKEWADTRGRKDHVAAELRHRHVVTGTGTFTGSFRARAAYAVERWKDDLHREEAERTIEGTFTVTTK